MYIRFLKFILQYILPKARPSFVIASEIRALNKSLADMEMALCTGDFKRALECSQHINELSKALRVDFYLAYEATNNKPQRKIQASQ